MYTKSLLVVAAAVAFLGLSGVAAGGTNAAVGHRGEVNADSAVESAREPGQPVTGLSWRPEAPLSPLGEQSALRAAKQYLSFSALSWQGLIQQLEFDGFSTAEATYAANSVAADWNQQAAKAAKQYMSFSALSRSGLYEQLTFDGFTPAQAAYGVSAVGY